MSTVTRVLPDTNIIAYVFAKASSNTVYRIRALLAQGLITGGGEFAPTLVLYGEQLGEIHRALDDLLIRGVLLRAEKQNVIDEIHREFDELVNLCRAVGRCIIVKRDSKYIRRAAALYRMLEQRKSRGWVRRLGRLTMDLQLLAVAEDYSAAVVTHDYNLYRVYRDALWDRLHGIPAVYYLDFGGSSVRYQVCGVVIPFLERLLDRVAGAVGVKRRETVRAC